MRRRTVRRRGKSVQSDPAGFLLDVLKRLDEDYTLPRPRESKDKVVKGQAFSHLVKLLREWDGWALPGRNDDRHYLFENVGFSIENGHNDRGNRAEVVYYERTEPVASPVDQIDEGIELGREYVRGIFHDDPTVLAQFDGQTEATDIGKGTGASAEAVFKGMCLEAKLLMEGQS